MGMTAEQLEAMRGDGRMPFLASVDWRKLDDSKRAECGLYKDLADCEAKVVDDGSGDNIVTMVASTKKLDRDGDTIDPKGWDIKAFKKGGPILFAHDQRSLPIGVSTSVTKDADRLTVTAKFTPEDLNPLGDRVFRMIKGGFLRGVSVGFLPTKHKTPDESEGRGMFAVDFLKQELLEVSVVPVPSNTDAFAAAKAAGIDLAPIAGWCEQAMEVANGPGVWMARETLERAYMESTERKTTIDLGRGLLCRRSAPSFRGGVWSHAGTIRDSSTASPVNSRNAAISAVASSNFNCARAASFLWALSDFFVFATRMCWRPAASASSARLRIGLVTNSCAAVGSVNQRCAGWGADVSGIRLLFFPSVWRPHDLRVCAATLMKAAHGVPQRFS